jgi:hypothetical protein
MVASVRGAAVVYHAASDVNMAFRGRTSGPLMNSEATWIRQVVDDWAILLSFLATCRFCKCSLKFILHVPLRDPRDIPEAGSSSCLTVM